MDVRARIQERFEVSSFVESEYRSICRVHNSVYTDYPQAIAELRHDDQVITSHGYFLKRFVARDRESSRVVGDGVAEERVERFQPDKLAVGVEVEPEFSDSGVGEALCQEIEKLSLKNKAKLLTTIVSERQGGTLEFWKAQGFLEGSSSIESRLDLRRVEWKDLEGQLSATMNTDVSVSTLAQERGINSNCAEDLCALENEAGEDVPISDRWRRMKVSEYKDLVHMSPAVVPSAWFIAKNHGEYVGESFLLRNRLWFPGSMGTGFTCVRQDFRGKGIARHLKLHGIRWAKKRGVSFIRTWNDSENKPMLTLNRLLGFENHAAWLRLEKRLHHTT